MTPVDTISHHGEHTSSVVWFGTLVTSPGDWGKIRIEGWVVEESPGGLLLKPKPNLVVNSGIQARLDRLFAINGPPPPVGKMGVDNGTRAPVPTTTQSADGSSTIRTLGPFEAPPVRVGQVVTMTKSFTQATVNFVMRRFFLSLSSTQDLVNSGTADLSGTLHSMTNPMTLDFTSLTAWSLTLTAQVTGTGT